MRTFIDPYLPPIFECEESLDTVDLCDSSVKGGWDNYYKITNEWLKK